MADSHVQQTTTPIRYMQKPEKEKLLSEFKGRSLQSLRTPAVVIDRAVFAQNCARMHDNARQWDADFRAHVKTHKTAEGVKLQLASSSGTTHAVVVSTLMEAWEIIDANLVKDGIVKDILYGVPLPVNKVADLANLSSTLAQYDAVIRVLVDHQEQIRFLEEHHKDTGNARKWSAFMKVDAGHKRAGLDPGSAEFQSLLEYALKSPVIEVFGFYCHAGNSYSSKSPEAASNFLTAEVNAVNDAAKLALSLLNNSGNETGNGEFVLSVGSTPTAHAATADSKAKLNALLHGKLELHAGNYPLLDLQQLHTGLIDRSRIAQKLLATVISCYPGRGANGTDEALCDAGAIALSKDTGPSGNFGEIIGKSWKLGRISQEHGILTRESAGNEDELKIGEVIEIVCQHACLTLAAHPWFYVVDSKDEHYADKVADVWVPWKGW